MKRKVPELKRAFRDVLGEQPGKTFYAGLEGRLDAGRDMGAICETCYRAEKTVKLFICEDKAEQVGRRWREIVSGPRQWVM